MIRYFGTHKGKVFINIFVSFGAVIVILGALGKILHATWGTAAITAGMLTECLIFLLMMFVPVEDHPHWDRYFPDLYKDPHDELAEKGGDIGMQKVNFAVGGGGDDNKQQQDFNPAMEHLEKMMEKADITPKNLKRLADSFEKINNTTAKIADMGNAAFNVSEFVNKSKETTAALDTLKASYLSAANDMNSNNFSEGIKMFYDQMFSLTKNISSLNNIYGVEIQETLTEIKKVKGYFSGMNDVAKELNGTITDVQQTKEQISLLLNNLSNLNDVYGRVLTAMQAR